MRTNLRVLAAGRKGRHSPISIFFILIAISATAALAQGVSAPGAGSSAYNAQLELGPVAGFTTLWHRAPQETAVPLGTILSLRVRAPIPDDVVWSGAALTYSRNASSFAEVRCDRLGPHAVSMEYAESDGRMVRETVVFEVIDTSQSHVELSEIRASADEVALAGQDLNAATMSVFFGADSVAALRDLGHRRCRTSIQRWIDLAVSVQPAGFAPLIEWSIDGKPQKDLGASIRVRLSSPRVHLLSAGPRGGGRELELATYQVVITNHDLGSGRRIPERSPVTFRAMTVPSGFEDDITWMASTKYGTAQPLRGHGPKFTVTFDGTVQAGSRWLGVRADNAIFGQDDKDVPRPPGPGEAAFPRIDTPEPEPRRPLELDPTALPPGAKAHLPALDGDRLFVTFGVTQRGTLSAEQVRDEIIVPVLAAVGFEPGAAGLSLPPAAGVPLPAASFPEVVAPALYEYSNHPNLLRPKTQQMLDTFAGIAPPSPEIDAALQMGEGMTFSQFVAGIERQAIDYPFQQMAAGRPIEHTLLLASRWPGQGITSVRGALIHHYVIVNEVSIADSTVGTPVVPTALASLRKVPGIESVAEQSATEGPVLVLLPYGTDATGAFRLHFAYRMILKAVALAREVEFLLWMDAGDGSILKLKAFAADTAARGAAFDRDPGIGTTTLGFTVDAASGSTYKLQRSAAINRVDYKGDGFDSTDVSISDSALGSSSTFANFDQSPINDASDALCAKGSNKSFKQVNFFAALSRYYAATLGLGIFTPFPTSPWNPKIESASAGCNAWFDMDFGACNGFFDADCPNFSDGTDDLQKNCMDFAQDNMVIAHELGHNSTWRFTDQRPKDWCKEAACDVPVGLDDLHGLTDFWAAHFESTNCYGGWVCKNVGGVDNSLGCKHHFENGKMPRLHEVTVPFDPAAPGDHFPEHRRVASDPYADMQIATAALWQVRLGMRSKCRPSGVPQFAVRFARALKEVGFLSSSPGTTDRGIYKLLYDLEVELLEQWATSGSPGGPDAFAHNGPHTTNKVTAGFARAGLFLVPYQCLDGDTSTKEPTFCPAGESGADAVIDVDDNDAADDYFVNEARHPEHDFLERTGPPPTFQVHTGPAYRFDAFGAATATGALPCNARFMVEVSADASFPAGSTVSSGWITVTADAAGVGSLCYGTWKPTVSQWDSLRAGGAGTRLYYRAQTSDAAGGTLRISTGPGNGLRTVPPPYAVITEDGQSDY